MGLLFIHCFSYMYYTYFTNLYIRASPLVGEWDSVCSASIDYGHCREQPGTGWGSGHPQGAETLHVRTNSSTEVTGQGKSDFQQGQILPITRDSRQLSLEN